MTKIKKGKDGKLRYGRKQVVLIMSVPPIYAFKTTGMLVVDSTFFSEPIKMPIKYRE